MDLFVYGTLLSARLAKAVLGGTPPDPVPGRVAGWSVRTLPGHVVPVVHAEDTGLVQGAILRGLTPEQVRRVCDYEGAFGLHRQEVSVDTTDGAVPAQMFVAPGLVDETAGPWDFQAWQTRHETAHVLTAEELFAQEPALDARGIAHAIEPAEKRAWARVRAAEIPSPAALRHAVEPGDLTLSNPAPPRGEFFRIQAFDVDHRRFDGGRSGTLRREVFLGMEAVLVLPYDPEQNRLVLVEQARMGPAWMRDPNPWTLEPVAGMVDARETPQEAALRETREEAGLTLSRLEPMSAFYPSPGSSTDYFHAYLGLCTVPPEDSYRGGLASENEDLRLHVLSPQDALALIDTGEIKAGPLILMLYWLDRNIARFQGA